MTTDTRTSRSMKNSTVALTLYFLNLALQFFSRKIFLDYLGTEVLGLNTTATNLLQFLNLAELGVGAAIACTLYQPLFEKNTEAINQIISLQGWIYRRIAYLIIAGAVLLMVCFPWIFAKMPLPLWYAYASFGVLLASALLSYFVNYKQIVLSADQRDYKIQYSYKTAMLVKVLFQILSIRYLDNGYVWWLIWELVFAVVASVALNGVIRRTYPYLKADIKTGRELRHKYPGVLTKVKQLFFHKIGSFALTQTSPIIIYAYTTLTLVALYGNYMLIITGVTALMGAVFNSMNGGVGNLVAEGNRRRILDVFEELFSARFLVTGVLCLGVYALTPAFITLWIGPEYVLDNFTLALMVAIMYINLSRLTVDAYINAYGLFRDIWAPVTEASINVGMSVLLGYFFGLHGILGGVLLSLIIVIFCWKPYFLFREGLREPLRKYIKMYAAHLAAAFVVFVLMQALGPFLLRNPAGSLLHFGSAALLYALTSALLLAAALYLTTPGMKSFVRRLSKIVR